MDADLERRGIAHVDVAGNQHCQPLQFSVFIIVNCTNAHFAQGEQGKDNIERTSTRGEKKMDADLGIRGKSSLS